MGGGQEYYGPTADRDKQVVLLLASNLQKIAVEDYGIQIQVITGGTAGVPDDFASHYRGNVLDVVSEEYVEAYKERTQHQHHRTYWVAGATQEQRRLAFATNPDIALALFIQGGQYTTHEIKIFMEKKKPIILFWGSGGASGGAIPYQGWSAPMPQQPCDVTMSTDPAEDAQTIALALMHKILNILIR